jgi:CRISPR-associated protein Cas1
MFFRKREGPPPNNLLNYGYAILRATVARAIVGTGLLPTLGIHHRNRYNAYCLADDIMEPYRPFVDMIVRKIIHGTSNVETLTKELKVQLLNIPTVDVLIDDQTSPLMIATQRMLRLWQNVLQVNSKKFFFLKCHEGKQIKCIPHYVGSCIF